MLNYSVIPLMVTISLVRHCPRSLPKVSCQFNQDSR